MTRMYLARIAALFSILLGTTTVCVSCSRDDPADVKVARTIFVTADRTGEVPTIQEALNTATDGDVIELGDGEFRGLGNSRIDFLGKQVTLRSRSRNPDVCAIELPTVVTVARAFVFQSGESPVIEGIKIANGRGGAYPIPDRATVGAIAPAGIFYGGALMCRRGASPTFKDCIFVNNFASAGAVALCVEGASPIFVGCTFYGNNGPDDLFSGSDATYTFERSLIVFNGCSVVPDVPSLNLLANAGCTDIYGNTTDWAGSISGLLGVNGNISEDPLFVDAGAGNLWLSAASPCAPDSSDCGLVGALSVE